MGDGRIAKADRALFAARKSSDLRHLNILRFGNHLLLPTADSAGLSADRAHLISEPLHKPGVEILTLPTVANTTGGEHRSGFRRVRNPAVRTLHRATGSDRRRIAEQYNPGADPQELLLEKRRAAEEAVGIYIDPTAFGADRHDFIRI